MPNYTLKSEAKDLHNCPRCKSRDIRGPFDTANSA